MLLETTIQTEFQDLGRKWSCEGASVIIIKMAIDKFIETIKALRDPVTGCPWNREQTHSSLKRYLLEELYECLEAIDLVEEISNDKTANDHSKGTGVSLDASNSELMLKEELGDVLLQVALHSQIAEERGAFTFNDVVEYVNEKMIRRHPHVFKDAKAANANEVDTHWEKIKKAEKSHRKSIFEGIPKELPALARAWLISKKAVRESFEWDEESKLWEQLQSEITELQEIVLNKESLNDTERAEAELELGDILFTAVNVARWFKIDPEDALRKTNNKFTERFDLMMEIVKARGADSLKGFSPEELEAFWKEAKYKQNELWKALSPNVQVQD
ncbi:MAG: nucleoside triphosphate pyrophosphohydrolase [bacterium]